MAEDYCSRCPGCGDHLIIRIDSIDCVSAKCGYTTPRRTSPEYNVEVLKHGEEPFNPPRRINHPSTKVQL